MQIALRRRTCFVGFDMHKKPISRGFFRAMRPGQESAVLSRSLRGTRFALRECENEFQASSGRRRPRRRERLEEDSLPPNTQGPPSGEPSTSVTEIAESAPGHTPGHLISRARGREPGENHNVIGRQMIAERIVFIWIYFVETPLLACDQRPLRLCDEQPSPRCGDAPSRCFGATGVNHRENIQNRKCRDQPRRCGARDMTLAAACINDAAPTSTDSPPS